MGESSSQAKWLFQSAALSPRQAYVLDTVLGRWWGQSWSWSSEGAMKGESTLHWDGKTVAIWEDHSLVTSNLQPKDGVKCQWGLWSEDEKMALWLPFFAPRDNEPQEDASSFLPMDPLAVTFWALTCWSEQAGEFALDLHGRPNVGSAPWASSQQEVHFHGSKWAAADQHRLPWVECMWHGLRGRTEWAETPTMTCQWTFDVDVAFKHLGRSWRKHWALQCRDVFTGRWSLVLERWSVMKGRWRDPYDTYGWITKTHHGMPLTWFVLAAKRRKPFDVGLDPARSVLPALVEQLDFAGPEHRVSWHPSWTALSDSGVFDSESTMVHSWPGIEPNAVRSHFLRGTPGKWWKRLVEHGISHDASLGWSDDMGFRNGISRPFQAYDLTREECMSLVIQPMAVMDEAMRGPLGWTPQKAAVELTRSMDAVAVVGGQWMSCWHNTSVSEDGEWEGWRATYVHMLGHAQNLGVTTL